MKRHHAAYGQQHETYPVGWFDILARRTDIHVEVGCHAAAICNLGALCKFVQSSSAALVEDKRVHQTELQSQKEENDSEHEIAIAIDVHDYPNP